MCATGGEVDGMVIAINYSPQIEFNLFLDTGESHNRLLINIVTNPLLASVWMALVGVHIGGSLGVGSVRIARDVTCKVTAERILPLIFPLLVEESLTGEQSPP